jgi:hypothetical protein
MQASKGLKMLAGAVALAISGSVFAGTVDTSTTPDLVLNITDLKTGASYQYDTGLSVATFNNSTGVQSFTLSGTNYANFEASIGSGDTVTYSVVGALSGTSPAITLDTGVNVAATVANGKANSALGALNAFYGQYPVSTPHGDVYVSATQAAGPGQGGWNTGGYETNWNTATNNTDGALVGTPLAFYQYTNQGTSGISKTGATATAFNNTSLLSSTWNLVTGATTGTLTYGVAATPLPAPLLLLLSGLGFMGVMTRRGQSGRSDASFNGAVS